MTDWHTLEGNEVVQALTTDARAGLSAAEAERRLAQFGPNELIERGVKSPWRILWEQVTAVMVLILLAAALLSAVLQKWTETSAIAAIVVLFVALGFSQEYRAERAMAALKKLAVPRVRAFRDGVLQELSARDLVPGDVLILEAGNAVPADVRILESVNLRVQEAMLTGESEPVEKEARALAGADLPLGDRRNMAYMGTVATYGRGVAVVVATGMNTEIGRIATLIQDVQTEETPLQRRLDRVGKTLAGAGVIAAVLVLIVGVLRGEPIVDMILTGISVAVAVVPEGLPAVVTFTLALGAQRMLRRQALIRKLPAVETLGSVTTICSDKTGTLTENRMTVTVIDVAGQRVDLTECMSRHAPALNPGECRPELFAGQPVSVHLILAGGALCNDALLRPGPAAGKYHTVGDPTEGALLVAAAQGGLFKDDLQSVMPRVAEQPFDSERKRMTTVHQRPAANALPAPLDSVWGLNGRLPDAPFVAITKGAVDGLLELASQVWDTDQPAPMTADWRARVQAANDRLAQDGMRVLGLAFRPVDSLADPPDLERDLIFVGLVGMMDPPRPEVRQAVQTCLAAGIRPVMITGDHPLTAASIARDLGISADAQVLTGPALDRLSAADLEGLVERVSVYARVSPEHKLRIVAALQARGQVVAMTGDGVNDAPALKKADIGVAMGLAGTDVAKEAANMVLLDDNFSTIVAAVEEGRVIYDNVRRFIKFSIAGNIGKVAVMLGAPLLGINVALWPLQLLWLNLLTDGLLGLGMGVEPAERDVMRRPPQSPAASLFSGGVGAHMVWVGVLFGALALGVGGWYYNTGHENWQTVLFSVLAFAQVGHALAIRSARESSFRIKPWSNPLLLGLAAVVGGLQLAAVYAPFLQVFLRTQPLEPADLAVCLGFGSLVFLAIEVEKLIARWRA